MCRRELNNDSLLQQYILKLKMVDDVLPINDTKSITIDELLDNPNKSTLDKINNTLIYKTKDLECKFLCQRDKLVREYSKLVKELNKERDILQEKRTLISLIKISKEKDYGEKKTRS